MKRLIIACVLLIGCEKEQKTVYDWKGVFESGLAASEIVCKQVTTETTTLEDIVGAAAIASCKAGFASGMGFAMDYASCMEFRDSEYCLQEWRQVTPVGP